MSISRRHAFAALIRCHGLLLIEDAATGLRVVFVAAPAAWISRIEPAIRATTWNTPEVMTVMAVSWLRDATVARQEAQKREDAQMHQLQVTQVFKGLACMRHPSSYFVWLPMPEDLRADQVAMALQTAGISVSTAEPICQWRASAASTAAALGLGAARNNVGMP